MDLKLTKATNQKKEKDALVIVPNSAIDTMNLGAMSGLVSIAQNNIPRNAGK